LLTEAITVMRTSFYILQSSGSLASIFKMW
jgi:hypothetical protein